MLIFNAGNVKAVEDLLKNGTNFNDTELDKALYAAASNGN